MLPTTTKGIRRTSFPLVPCGVRGKTMSGGEVESEIGSPANPHKLYVSLGFNHYQKHVMFSMDGADFKNKKLHEGVRVLVAVRA